MALFSKTIKLIIMDKTDFIDFLIILIDFRSIFNDFYLFFLQILINFF